MVNEEGDARVGQPAGMGNDLHLLLIPSQPTTGHLRPPLGSVLLFCGSGLTVAVPEQLSHRAAILQ